MKLFIWDIPAPLGVYGTSLVCVLAGTTVQARKLAIEKVKRESYISARAIKYIGKEPPEIIKEPEAVLFEYFD